METSIINKIANISLPAHSFTYDDLKIAFEEGGENIEYNDEHGFSLCKTFEQWFEKWLNRK